MWRPGFDFVERRHGFVRGFVRRFFQGSTDHRGVPGRPGRVVTMIEDSAGICWGTAYRIAPPDEARVVALLDHREKGGYRRLVLPVHDEDGRVVARALSYVATPDNEAYLGEASLPEIARQVIGASGPSGRNVDYVLALAAALRAIRAHDPHVFALEEAVTAALGENRS